MFCKNVLKNFAKFKVKHLCQSLFFNKVAGLRSATLLKKTLWHRCFPAHFVKFTRTPFLQKTSGGCFWSRRSMLESYFKIQRLIMVFGHECACVMTCLVPRFNVLLKIDLLCCTPCIVTCEYTLLSLKMVSWF